MGTFGGGDAEAMRLQNNNTVVVRPWGGLSSMSEVLAIIRAVEERFGSVRDFMVQRVRHTFLQSGAISDA